MKTSNESQGTRRAWVTVSLIVCLFWGAILWCIIGITGYFKLSSETVALRESVMQSVPCSWNKQLALRVGWFTTAACRLGSSCLDLPSEARAALKALHGAEVGIYQAERELSHLNAAGILKTADEQMKRRGWDRIVGVATEHELVAVYFPNRKTSAGAVKCCVMVYQGRELVVSSVRGNLDPLFALARQHIDFEELKRQVPQM